MGNCNYCTLKDLRIKYKDKGRVNTRSGPIDEFTKDLGRGIDVIFIPKGKTISDGKTIAWFMELPKKCAC